MKNPTSVITRIIAILAIPTSLYTQSNNMSLIDIPSVMMVAIPIVTAILCLNIGSGQRWARTCLVLGLPMGLLATTIGMVQITLSLSELVVAGPSMAFCLLTLLYGGLVSAVGFAAMEPDDNGPTTKCGFVWWVIPLVVTIAVMIWGALLGGFSSIRDFFRLDVFFVTVASIIVFMSFRKNVSPVVRWSEASLFASIIATAVAILRWFGDTEYASGQGQFDPIHYANIGLLYGAIAYIGGYFFSFRNLSSRYVEAERMNWHFLEVNAFLYFMTIAPSSIPDTLLIKESNTQLSAYQDSVADRLSKLETEIERLRK